LPCPRFGAHVTCGCPEGVDGSFLVFYGSLGFYGLVDEFPGLIIILVFLSSGNKRKGFYRAVFVEFHDKIIEGTSTFI